MRRKDKRKEQLPMKGIVYAMLNAEIRGMMTITINRMGSSDPKPVIITRCLSTLSSSGLAASNCSRRRCYAPLHMVRYSQSKLQA